MGFPADSIGVRSTKVERKVFDSFVVAKAAGAEIPWTIRYRGVPIGVAWLDLIDTAALSGPALHIMIGDLPHRGRGFGSAVVRAMIVYAADHMRSSCLHTRHLTVNAAADAFLRSAGFSDDGDPYQDEHGLAWQNKKLVYELPVAGLPTEHA